MCRLSRADAPRRHGAGQAAASALEVEGLLLRDSVVNLRKGGATHRVGGLQTRGQRVVVLGLALAELLDQSKRPEAGEFDREILVEIAQ